MRTGTGERASRALGLTEDEKPIQRRPLPLDRIPRPTVKALSRRDGERISGLALILGPLEFVIATLVEGALIPGYGLISHWIGVLGAPPNNAPRFAPGTDLWWVFTVSLTLMALLLFVGLVGLKRVLWPRPWGKVVLALLVVVAVGSIGVAVFNEVDYLPEHSIAALSAFGTGWIALVVFGIGARKDPHWSTTWSGLSIVGGLASLIALVPYASPPPSGGPTSRRGSPPSTREARSAPSWCPSSSG